MRHGVTEIEMKDDPTFSAIAHSDKQISRQISIRPDKKIYLFSVPARPENCPRPQYVFFYIFL